MKKLLLFILTLSCLLPSCTKDFGTVEVTYTKAVAIYEDLSVAQDSKLLTEAESIVNAGKVFVSQDMLLIGEEGKGIHIVDNSTPTNPVNLSFLNIPGNREYYVEGTTLYAESRFDMIKIDISDKNNPQLVSTVKDVFANSADFENAQGETLVGFHFEEVTEVVEEDGDIHRQLWNHQNVLYFDYAQRLIPPSQVPVSFAGNSSSSIGTVNRIAVVDDFVYVISRDFLTPFQDNGQLIKYDPVFVSNNMETIYPNGRNLFIGTAQSMEVLDISTPSEPRWASAFSHARSCDPVLPSDDVVYITLRTGEVGNCPGDINALVVVNMDSGFPTQVQEIQMKSPFGMTLYNDKLYVGEGQNGLKVFDASNKTELELETFETGIEAYDIINHPTNPNLLLIAGPEGISQYEVEGTNYSLLSTLAF